MKIYKAITGLSFLITLAMAQVTPFEPPLGEITHIGEVQSLYFGNQPKLHKEVLFSNGMWLEYDKQLVWQMYFQFDDTYSIEVSLDDTQLENQAKVYYRIPQSGTYVGPFTIHHDSAIQGNTIGHLSTSSFLLEIDFPPGYTMDISILTKIDVIVEKVSEHKKVINQSGQDNYYQKNNNRELPIILLTGYWPPTNEMVRHFSQNPELNPGGWQGDDWEERGFDVVSYFPSFADPDCDNCGQGYGDIEVDYQDTSNDYWPITEENVPIAVITFSRGFIDHSWELEYNFYNRTNWIGDYSSPYMPTPNPPDEDEASYFLRNSNLPMNEIVDAVSDMNIGLNAYIDENGDPGHFVSEFMGYHGVWYRDLNGYGENPCITAGHVHVGGLIDVATARLATEETIRQVINYLDQFSYISGDINQDGAINIQDLVLAVSVILNTYELSQAQFYAADVNTDGIINIQDIIIILNMIINGG